MWESFDHLEATGEGGKFNMSEFYKCKELMGGKDTVIRDTHWLRKQAKWWRISLQVARYGSPILYPDGGFPAHARQAWSDAAGGALM